MKDVLVRLQAMYPHEPMLYSFRRYLEVIYAGGFDAARAALERHIEWKALLVPFRDEITQLRAEMEDWKRTVRAYEDEDFQRQELCRARHENDGLEADD